jgi:hypothetical protein
MTPTSSPGEGEEIAPGGRRASGQRKSRLCGIEALDLRAYLGGTLKGLGCLPIETNTEPDLGLKTLAAFQAAGRWRP